MPPEDHEVTIRYVVECSCGYYEEADTDWEANDLAVDHETGEDE